MVSFRDEAVIVTRPHRVMYRRSRYHMRHSGVFYSPPILDDAHPWASGLFLFSFYQLHCTHTHRETLAAGIQLTGPGWAFF